jgi:hypothetical protein
MLLTLLAMTTLVVSPADANARARPVTNRRGV